MTLEQRFMGLADRTRLRILNLLFQGELCGCDIQYVLHTSQSAVSRHLGYLKRIGLVVDRRDGYRVYYRLASLDTAGVRLMAYLRFAFTDDAAFVADVKGLKSAVSEGACTVSETKVLPARRSARAPSRTRRAT